MTLKFSNLRRLPFSLGSKVFRFSLLKRLDIELSKEDKLILGLYHHLVKNDGVLRGLNDADFTAKYTLKDGAKVTLSQRHRPSSDLDVFNQVFTHHEYKPLTKLILKHYSKDSPLNIIDGGSNIGLSTCYLSTVFPNARFCLVEPDDNNLIMVRRNLTNNNLEGCHILAGGIWNKNTYLTIVNDFRDKKEWAIRVEETESESGLKAYTIQKIMEGCNFDHIDLLKLDIEGAEKQVFADVEAANSFLSKTKFIAIEIHDEFECREDIYNILEANNFEIDNTGELTIGFNKSLLRGQSKVPE